MPRKKHSLSGPEPAVRQFTDREDLLAAFEAGLQGQAPDRPRVIVYYGVGGIGKTRLLKELKAHVEASNAPPAHVLLDFRDTGNHVPAEALLRVRRGLKESQRLPFPTFDVAFAHYFALAHPQRPLNRSELPFLEPGEWVSELISAVASVPGAGLVAKIPKALDQLSTVARDWWEVRGKPALRHIVALEQPHEVEEWLPALWAEDVKDWLAKKPDRRAVLFLDTFEALLEEGTSRGEAGTPRDDWVQEWAARLEGVLLVFATRSKLRWDEQDPSWQGLLEQHLVGELAPEDSNRFLESCGVAEPELRAAIVKKSQGVPLYLDLAVTHYAQMWEKEQHRPQPEEFDDKLPELLGRFLHYLDLQERSALFVLSVPDTFDVETFSALMKEFGTGLPATTHGLRTLQRFPIVQEVEGDRFALHALVREAFAATHDPDEIAQRTAVHRYLFERAKALLEAAEPLSVGPRERRALTEAVTHGWNVLGPEEFLEWFSDVEETFDRQVEWRTLLPLDRTLLLRAEYNPGPEHPRTLTIMNNLAYLLHDRGKLEEAESLFRRALAAQERILGPEHADTLTSVNNLASLLQDQGQLKKAEPLYRGALEVRERVLGPQHPDTLTSVNNLASLLQDRGKLKEAEQLTRRALEARKRVLGPEHPDTLTSVHNLAVLLQDRGEFEEAEPLHRRALKGFERVLGPEHPGTLTSVNNLACVLQARGQLEEAEPLYRRAVEVRERVLGPEHPDTLTSVNNLASLLQDRGELEEAEPLYRRALEGCERTLGPENPDTLISVNNLAYLLKERGELEEAEPLYRRALEGFERILGPEHPDTLISANNVASLLQARGRLKEAEPLFRRAVEGLKRVLGPEHPDTLTSVQNLASLLQERRQLDAVDQPQRHSNVP